jgi:hypothetical protein
LQEEFYAEKSCAVGKGSITFLEATQELIKLGKAEEIMKKGGGKKKNRSRQRKRRKPRS